MPYCGNCGKPIEDDSLFCGFCGAPVEPDEFIDDVANDTQSDSAYMNASQNTVHTESSTISEEAQEKDIKVLKGLRIAFISLGILVFFAIVFIAVIVVKDHKISDIDSTESDHFVTSTYSSITIDENELSDNMRYASEFSITYEDAWDLIAPIHSSEPILTQEQAIEAFERYMDENYTRGEDGAPYGIDTSFKYEEEYSNYYTCAYSVKGYLGAQAYLCKYFFMDLTTGSVYTIEYEDSTFSAVENPGIEIHGTVFDVFNGLEYIQ